MIDGNIPVPTPTLIAAAWKIVSADDPRLQAREAQEQRETLTNAHLAYLLERDVWWVASFGGVIGLGERPAEAVRAYHYAFALADPCVVTQPFRDIVHVGVCDGGAAVLLYATQIMEAP